MLTNKDKYSEDRVMRYVMEHLLLYITAKDKFMIQCVLNKPAANSFWELTNELERALQESDFKRTEFSKPRHHFGDY